MARITLTDGDTGEQFVVETSTRDHTTAVDALGFEWRLKEQSIAQSVELWESEQGYLGTRSRCRNMTTDD